MNLLIQLLFSVASAGLILVGLLPQTGLDGENQLIMIAIGLVLMIFVVLIAAYG